MKRARIATIGFGRLGGACAEAAGDFPELAGEDTQAFAVQSIRRARDPAARDRRPLLRHLGPPRGSRL
jgi:hypothetical protein